MSTPMLASVSCYSNPTSLACLEVGLLVSAGREGIQSPKLHCMVLPPHHAKNTANLHLLLEPPVALIPALVSSKLRSPI